MINLHESMGPGRDRIRDPWICNQESICIQTRYLLRHAARLIELKEDPNKTWFSDVSLENLEGRKCKLNSLIYAYWKGGHFEDKWVS